MLLLTSAYLAPVHYYARLYAEGQAIEERADHYVKQTYRNRCVIAAAHGPLSLTIPVEGMPKEEGGTSKTPMRDIRMSEHGRWRHLHWTALVSAYEASPYFEYYADDFRRIYDTQFGFLADFNEAMRSLVLDLLDLHPTITTNTDRYLDASAMPHCEDLRESIRPKVPYSTDPRFQPAEYYQVFRPQGRFLPNLSIADLLFNMGPESRSVLRNSVLPPQ